MSMTEDREAAVLESLRPNYEADGFEVFIHPSPSILPPFMQSYRPDAVALSPYKKIAIELVSSADASTRKVTDLESLFAPHQDWELRVVYLASDRSEEGPDVASLAVIEDSIKRVADLDRQGHRLPALIMAWAALEAIGRALLPERLKRPQTPGRLVEVLASDGYVTPEEADTLRAAISIRNAAVHGSPGPVVDEGLVERFISILKTLRELLKRQP
jgi:uncharacterized protein YutE (UPF0331/DUF86 family)